MIRINAFILATEETRAAVLAAAKSLTAASLEEQGCVSYDIFESATRPEVLMFCETWEDEAALEAHTHTEAFAKYFGEIKALAQVKIEKLNL